METDEQAVKEAAMRLAMYLRREDFIQAIRSGEIDLQYDLRNENPGSSAA
ncbi:hypothetical protein [Streptomyces sp. NPDC050485]